MNPAPTKCFMVEATGVTRKRRCHCRWECPNEVTESEYKRLDSGETLFGYPSDFGPGAMWYEPRPEISEGKPYYWDNDADRHLIVMTPGGSWDIDSRASNCGSPNERLHRCWIRHGIPPLVTVDKQGFTCSAGGGSIRAGSYHGFLRNGILTA